MFFDVFIYLLAAVYMGNHYGLAFLFLFLSYLCLTQFGYLLLFKKAEISPWKALIPGYNLYLFYRFLYKDSSGFKIAFPCILGSEAVIAVLLLAKISVPLVLLSAGFFGYLLTVFIYYDIIKAFGDTGIWRLIFWILCPWAFLIFYGLDKESQYGKSIRFVDTDNPNRTARVVVVLLVLIVAVIFFKMYTPTTPLAGNSAASSTDITPGVVSDTDVNDFSYSTPIPATDSDIVVSPTPSPSETDVQNAIATATDIS